MDGKKKFKQWAFVENLIQEIVEGRLEDVLDLGYNDEELYQEIVQEFKSRIDEEFGYAVTVGKEDEDDV